MRQNLKAFRKMTSLLALAVMTSCSNNENLEEPIKLVDLNVSSVTEKKIDFPETSPKCRDGFFGDQFYLFSGGTDVNKIKRGKEIDDRTCYYDYTQRNISGITTGVYQLKADSNHIDGKQPKIERASQTVDGKKKGTYVRISGYLTVNRVGHVSDNLDRTHVNDGSGSYPIQAKGKDTSGKGSKDPAIALLLIKPIKWDANGQSEFSAYLEVIKERGGSGTDGRIIIDLQAEGINAKFKRGQRRFVSVKTGFRDKFGNLEHYVDVKIGNQTYTFEVPSPELATQAKLRFGAYRCKGGEAELLWDTVIHKIKKS